MLRKAFSKFLISLSFLTSASVFAAPASVTVDFSDIVSYGSIGDPGNFVGFLGVGANSVITSIEYSGNLTAFDPSWLSEMRVAFVGRDPLGGVHLAAAAGVTEPGTGDYSGFGNLVELGLDFAVGADGLLRVEFFESYDDYLGVDGIWNFGSFTIGVDTVDQPAPVPEPASALLLAAGLAAIGHTRRRSARQPAHAAH